MEQGQLVVVCLSHQTSETNSVAVRTPVCEPVLTDLVESLAPSLPVFDSQERAIMHATRPSSKPTLFASRNTECSQVPQ